MVKFKRKAWGHFVALLEIGMHITSAFLDTTQQLCHHASTVHIFLQCVSFSNPFFRDVGKNLVVPGGAKVIDAHKKLVIPGNTVSAIYSSYPRVT